MWNLFLIGWTLSKIAKTVGCSVSTVHYTVERFKEINNFNNRPGRGRKNLLTVKDVEYVKINSLRDRRKTLSLLTAEFNVQNPVKVSLATIRRSLKSRGLIRRVAAAKPLLRKANIKKRLLWARQHKDWGLDEWYQVLFTDETKSECFGTNRRVYVRRRKGERFLKECLKPTIKHGGGSVMAWGQYLHMVSGH